MGEISVDVASLRQGKTVIDESVSEFESYSKDFLEDVILRLTPFNSDFVTKINRTLDNMKDTAAPELVEALQGYSGQLSIIADSFTELDDAAADNIGYTKE